MPAFAPVESPPSSDCCCVVSCWDEADDDDVDDDDDGGVVVVVDDDVAVDEEWVVDVLDRPALVDTIEPRPLSTMPLCSEQHLGSLSQQ